MRPRKKLTRNAKAVSRASIVSRSACFRPFLAFCDVMGVFLDFATIFVVVFSRRDLGMRGAEEAGY